MFASLIGYLLASLTAASILYCIIAMYVSRRFFSTSPERRAPHYPPATLMIPLRGVDFRAYENYASFCRLDYPEYQIVFGVQDPKDSSIPVVRQIMRDFPHRDIALVVDSTALGQNPKVSNLNNMLHKAVHETLVLVDSDMRVQEDYLKVVVPPSCNQETGLVTCFYRAGAAPSLPAKIEALGIATDFAPGVLMADFIEGISFAFGATIVITREKLRAIGGFRAVADHLADDYMLGNLLWKMGYKIKLIPHVVETILPASTFGGMLRHQVRWARGIRACRPLGHLGSLVTQTLPLASLNALYNGGSWGSLLLLGFAALARLGVAWAVGIKALGDATARANLHLVPFRDFLAFFIWIVSVRGRKVEWRGRAYRIVGEGKIEPMNR